MRVYVRMFVCVYSRKSVYVSDYLCVYECICVMHLFVYICMCWECMCVCECVCVLVSVLVCLYWCAHARVCVCERVQAHVWVTSSDLLSCVLHATSSVLHEYGSNGRYHKWLWYHNNIINGYDIIMIS